MTDYAKTKVQRFRKQFQRRYGDGHYFFACHAAFPVAFSVDMLYQLWANFKDVPKEAIQKAESLLPLKSRSIDRLAVSDLLQSGLCRQTDGDLFEIETEVRVYLLNQLEHYFSGQRLDELARFSFQYADRRIKDPYYRAFRDTQRWVSLARLAPEKAGEQLAAYYNLMVQADNAAEVARLDALLESLTLMDARFSDLREFSRAIRAAYTDQSEDQKLETAREAFRKVVRIRSEVAGKAGGIKVQLHDRLKQQTFEFKEEIKDEGQVLQHRINQSQDKGALELDLSGMDLTSVPEEVFRQTSLEKLDLSNNQISALPEALGYLKNLKQLILDHNKIEELPDVLAQLSELEVFSLKGNRIDFLPDWIVDFQNLQRLDVRGNPLKNIRQDKLLFEQATDFRVLDWFFKPQPLGFNQPMVMILITDPSDREIVLRALEPVVDSGQLHIEFPEEIKPWQLFRLFRQFDREQICLLHVNGYDSEDVFAYGIGPDTHSVSFRVWKGIIGQVPEGKMCFLSSGTSNRMVDQMLDLGFDACFSADTFQSEGDQLEEYMDRLYRSLGNGRSLREAEAYAREPFDPPPQEQMAQLKTSPLTNFQPPYRMDIRSEEVLGWRMVELDIPKSFASLNDVKVWLEDRLMSGGPGAIFTPLREMLSDDSPAKEELGKLQYDWEQRRSEEARRSFYESEESPMRNFVRAIAEEDLVEGLIAPQGATSWFLGIGISKHLQLPDIRNAVNDVLEMQRTLEEKYELDESTLLFDAEATTENILKNFDELLDRVKPADRVLIYYCGHTEMDPKLDRGYWLPFDAEANRRSSYLDNNTIIDYIRNISCKDLLLIVDGVFSGALFESGRGSTAQSYTEPSAGVSRWGFVSGQDKGIVGDGPPARFSPFADSILEVLKRNTEPQLGIEEIAEQVTKSMMSRVSARQTPAFGPLWGAGHGEGEYVFRLKESAAGEGQVTEEAAAAEEQRILTLEGHEAGVNCVAFSPDGNLIASGSDDQTVRVWEAGTGKEMMTLERHKSSVSSLAFSSDGQKIISGSEDGTIVIWEFLIGDITQIAGEESRVNCIRVLPEGNAFISGSEDGMIRIWDISGKLLTTLSEHKGSVNSIALNLAEQQFLSGSTDRTFKIWDLRKGALIRTFEGHGEEVHGVLFTPDGQSIISYTWGGPIKVWDAQTGNLRFVMEEHPPEVRKMVALSIGSDIATASADGLVRIWNLESRELLQSFSGHNDIVTDLAYNRDDLLLASSSLDGTVKVWRIATQTQEETINQPDPVIKKLQADMVPVAGGTFTMGWLSKERDGEGDDNEKPAHEVTLDDFHIGRYPVTQAQWRAVMGNNPSSNKACDDCPVERVSWNDVQDFLEKLNKLTGQQYRLPTEAEWEFAARGGNQSQGYLYSGSNDLDEVGWYYKNANSKTHPVGQKKANELGLFDISGNVWEWCQDWYGDYPSALQKNPKGRESGSLRVFRGGGWNNSPQFCRAAYRNFIGPTYRHNDLGFRLARSSG